MRNQRLPIVLLLGLLGLALAGCRTTYIRRSAEVPGKIGPEEVPGAIAAVKKFDFFKFAEWKEYVKDIQGNRQDLVIMVKRLHKEWSDF